MKRLKSKFNPVFFIFFLVIFGCFIDSFAATKSSGVASGKGSESPTIIRSDIIDIKRKSQTINFLNNVVVEKDDSSLLAQKMKVIYDEKKKDASDGKSSIKRIEATDNVKIFSEEFIANGDFGYYDPENNTFILEKNVVVNNGTSIANGDKFIYNLMTKKGQFVGKKNESSITENGTDKRVVVVIGDDIKEQQKLYKKSKKTNEQQNSKR